MLNRLGLVVVGALVLGAFPSGALFADTAARASECSQGSRTSDECPTISAEVGTGSVLISATQTTSGGTSGGTSEGTSSGTSSSTARLPWSPPPPRSPVLGTPECSIIVAGRCRVGSPSKNSPAATPSRVAAPSVVVAPTPPSSISDLAHFSPNAASFVLEPGSWSLPRLPTNMFSRAVEHQVPGQLLGWPIEVRFTPRVFRWNYGDGGSGTSSGSGSSWGGAQFSSTGTSHVYRQTGVYTVSLAIDYSVAYRFSGGNFVPLAGTLTQSAGTQQLSVLRVTPVLVNHGCEVGSLREGRC